MIMLLASSVSKVVLAVIVVAAVGKWATGITPPVVHLSTARPASTDRDECRMDIFPEQLADIIAEQ